MKRDHQADSQEEAAQAEKPGTFEVLTWREGQHELAETKVLCGFQSGAGKDVEVGRYPEMMLQNCAQTGLLQFYGP